MFTPKIGEMIQFDEPISLKWVETNMDPMGYIIYIYTVAVFRLYQGVQKGKVRNVRVLGENSLVGKFQLG